MQAAMMITLPSMLEKGELRQQVHRGLEQFKEGKKTHTAHLVWLIKISAGRLIVYRFRP